ncbi:unnamed protein product, partial [Wuchereria bancrofti]
RKRSVSVDGQHRSNSRNLDLHEKSDKIPPFCEDLSALMEEPLFDPSLSYFISRHNTSSDHESTCDENDNSHDNMQYVSTDLNKVKDNWNWQSVTNLSALQITPNKEMLYEEEQHLVNSSFFFFLLFALKFC